MGLHQKINNIFGIASAMSHLHSHNILHRDLKTENILFDEHLFPKIGDFGLTHFFWSIDFMTQQSVSGIKGSQIYSSPEVIQYNEYSKSSDVYSFSLIVYEITTSEIPFKDSKNENLICNNV